MTSDSLPAAPAATLARLELSAAFLLTSILLWQPWTWFVSTPTQRLAFQVGLICAIAVVVLGSFARTRESASALGVARSQLSGGWAASLIPTALAVAALVAAGLALGSWDTGAVRLKWALPYLPSLAAQQILLQAFLNNRVYASSVGRPEVDRRRHAVVMSTTIFAALHLPNPGLFVATAIAGAFWTWHFRTYRNLPALMLSHALVGVVAMLSLGNGPLLRLNVGLPALQLLVR